MTESTPIPGPDPRANPIQGSPSSQGARVESSSGKGGENFRALLDSLERRAGALEEKSRSELDPEELAGAVDDARESMHDALALQDELLEAWRQARHQAPTPEGGEPGA